MKKYNIAIVGATGAVGQEILKVLAERDFPFDNIKMLASERSKGKKINYQGKEYTVEATGPDSFADYDIVLFAGGGASKLYAHDAVKAGAIVIDNSSTFRYDPEVPLIVPEVNPEDAHWHKGIIANPNCSTIQMVVALKPLHDAAKIKRIVVSTYQAVSGAGREGIDELKDQVAQLSRQEVAADIKEQADKVIQGGATVLSAIKEQAAKFANTNTGSAIKEQWDKIAHSQTMGEVRHHLGKISQSEIFDDMKEQLSKIGQPSPLEPNIFQYQIAFNVIPHIDVFQENDYTKEEMKMTWETQKMFHDPDIAISATAVRVPVFRSHSEAINIELEKPLSADEAKEILRNAPGVIVIDSPSEKEYPMPLFASDTDQVYVGRIRKDISTENGLALWVVADQIRKGAATNSVQIAELLIKENLV
ncbi:MAG: aspartate-semialdehyde dehydrogenase [Bacillota bacterium]|jgi:aspartate-semialdehyde dehydrogenase